MYGVIVTKKETIILSSDSVISILTWLAVNKTSNSSGYFVMIEEKFISIMWWAITHYLLDVIRLNIFKIFFKLLLTFTDK